MSKKIVISMIYYPKAAGENWREEWDQDFAAMKDTGCDVIWSAFDIRRADQSLLEDQFARWSELLEKYDLYWAGRVAEGSVAGNCYVIPDTGDVPEEYTMVDVWGSPLKHESGGLDPKLFPYTGWFIANIWSPRYRQEVHFRDMERTVKFFAKCPRYTGGGYSELFQFTEPVSYGKADASRFWKFLQKKYGDLGKLAKAWKQDFRKWEQVEPPRVLALWTQEWQDWVEARHQWTAEWANETVSFAKTIKPDIKVWLCDCAWNQSPWGNSNRDLAAIYTEEIAKPFDCFLVEDHFYSEKMPREKILKCIENDIGVFRRFCGHKHLAWSGQVMRYTDSRDLDPDDAIAWLEKALECGVDELWYYNYRSSQRTGGSFDHKKSLCHNRKLLKRLAEFHKEIKP